MEKQPCVYLLASRKQGVLYIGVTSNLIQRVWQHKHHMVKGFTSQYHIHRLVYFEQFDNMVDAITREKQLKNWRRAWKVALIEQANPEWRDLYPELIG